MLLFGENGVIASARNSKFRQEDEVVKEDFSLAWLSLLTKYKASLIEGETTYQDIFTINNLKNELQGGGTIKSLIYDGEKDAFVIEYTSEIDVDYVGEWTPIGKILKFERK